MKSNFKVALAFAIAFGLCAINNLRAETADAGAAKPVRYIIGLSPFLDREVKDVVYRRIVGFLLEDVPLNSSLWLYDAYHLRTIMQATVPNVRAFRSAKTRANQFKEPIHKLKEFLATAVEPPVTNRLKLERAIRFPQFMDFVAENLGAPGLSIVVIVLGSPLYLDPKEPFYSMVDGYFPSDGHLMATREKSVYGIQNRAEKLKDIVVEFGYFGDPWVSEVHREKISRFWSLYLKGQGARLASFCGDLPTIFNDVRAGANKSAGRETPYEIDRTQTKIEMLRIARDVGVSDWITRDVVPNAQRSPPNSTVGPMKIGIRWRGNIDLDLYAKPRANAETLYFEHTRIPEGYYFKDHRTSPEREYEFIEFESPVDVWQVDASINFYGGSSRVGPSGEIRIEFEGKIFTGQFSIPARRGNQGREGGSQNEFWTRIDVPAILKLSPGVRESSASREP